MKIFTNIMAFCRVRYISFVEFVAASFIAVANRMIRHLILLKGKDPDYVPPPPPPPPEKKWIGDDPKKAENLFNRFYSAPRTSAMADGEWVKNMNKHPVLEARKAYESRFTSVVGEPQLSEDLSPEEEKEIVAWMEDTKLAGADPLVNNNTKNVLPGTPTEENFQDAIKARDLALNSGND
jgi:hypothetical protein